MSSQTPHGKRHGTTADFERERRRQEEAIRRLTLKRLNRDQPIPLRWLDYRFWQCRRCQFDPDEELGPRHPGQTVFDWFKSLHWRTRGFLIELSRGLRQLKVKKRGKIR